MFKVHIAKQIFEKKSFQWWNKHEIWQNCSIGYLKGFGRIWQMELHMAAIFQDGRQLHDFYRKRPVNIINLMMLASHLVQLFFEIINSIMFIFSEWNYKMAAIFQDDHQWYDLQYKKSYKLHPKFDETDV